MNRQELKAALAPYKQEYGIDFRCSTEDLQMYYNTCQRQGKFDPSSDDLTEEVVAQPGIGIVVPSNDKWVIWLTLDYPLTVERTGDKFQATDRYGLVHTCENDNRPGSFRAAIIDAVTAAARQHSSKFNIEQAVVNWETPKNEMYLGPMIQQVLEGVNKSYRLDTTESILGTMSIKALKLAPEDVTNEDWGEFTGVNDPTLALGKPWRINDFHYHLRCTPNLQYHVRREGQGPWLIWQYQDGKPGMFSGFAWSLDSAIEEATTQGSLWVAENGSLFENALIALFVSKPPRELLMRNVDVVLSGRNAVQLTPITDIFDTGDVVLLPSEIEELHPKGFCKGLLMPLSRNLCFKLVSLGEGYSLKVETVDGVEEIQLYDNFTDAFDRAVFELGKALAMMRDRNPEGYVRYLSYAKQSGSFHAVAAVCVALG